MIIGSVTIRTYSNEIIYSVRTTVAAVDYVVCLQNLVFGFTANLTGVIIPCKNKIPFVIESISLAVLIIHALYIGVYHFGGIKFTYLYMQLCIWYKTTKSIYPSKMFVYSAL